MIRPAILANELLEDKPTRRETKPTARSAFARTLPTKEWDPLHAKWGFCSIMSLMRFGAEQAEPL